jgi:G patch domain/KOW motif-containing protein
MGQDGAPSSSKPFSMSLASRRGPARGVSAGFEAQVEGEAGGSGDDVGARESIRELGGDRGEKKEANLLVIPLASNPWEKRADDAMEEEDEKPETEDEAAAKAILRDIAKSKAGEGGADLLGNGSMIIPMGNGSGTQGGLSRKPLLAAHSIPGLREAENEDEKFKFDLAVRADDIDVTSSVYASVPIEQFGAAMLRGMGWTGPPKDGEKDGNAPRVYEPRQQRLGLGAAPKPPEEMGTRRRRRPGEAPSRKDLEAEAALQQWKQKAAKEPMRGLTVGDVVLLDIRGEQRGMILRTEGGGLQPGYVRIRREEGGQEHKIPGAGLKKVGEEDLAREPFSIRREGDGRKRTADRRDEEEDEQRADGEERHSKAPRKSSKHKKRSRSRSRSRDQDHSKRKREKEDYWLTDKIRVRVVSKSYGSSAYTKKGVVIDVPAQGRATLRMDESSGSKVLEDVKQKHLETVIPKRGGKVILLRGKLRGGKGQLMARDVEAERAVVQLFEDMSVHTVPLDDVTEYTGMLDGQVEADTF